MSDPRTFVPQWINRCTAAVPNIWPDQSHSGTGAGELDHSNVTTDFCAVAGRAVFGTPAEGRV